MTAPQLYSVEQAAQMLLVKPSWLRRQCERRQVPFHMIARRYRFSDMDLTQIAEACHRTPTRRAAPIHAAGLRVAGRPDTSTPGRPARGRAS